MNMIIGAAEDVVFCSLMLSVSEFSSQGTRLTLYQYTGINIVNCDWGGQGGCKGGARAFLSLF